MSEHARLSPSNKRWPHCPGSVREEEKYPDTSGDAAIDGTGSHVLLELSLINNVQANTYDQLIIGDNHHDKPMGWLVDIERCDRVQICLDYVARRQKELKELFPGCIITVQTESKSNPGAHVNRDDWWGTCDITIIARDKDGWILFIEVVDYKDGRMYVSEKWNTQLVSYLYGKLAENNLGCVPGTGMRMTIIQPKTSTPIRYMCSTKPDDGLNKDSLMGKVNWLTESAAATDDPNAPLIPGKHCQWCKHNPKRGGTCTASTNKSMETIKEMTTEIAVLNDNDGLLELITNAVSDIKSLSPVQLSKLADSEAGFQAAFDKVKKEIQGKIESGVPVPGYAMLPGRASKIWSEDEDVVVKKLKAKRFKKDEIFPSKLVTPAAALAKKGLTDVQKKKISDELISEKAGNMTLKKVEYDHSGEKDVNQMFEKIDTSASTPLIMTEKANGATYEQFIEAGWTDQQMIDGDMATNAIDESDKASFF